MGKLDSRMRRDGRLRDGRWVRRGVAVAAVALGAGLLAGVSGATSPSTNVRFTPLTPPFKLMTNVYVGANATKTVVITGGSTTVPTNATTVQITVTAKGTKAGTLSFYPTGNPSGTSGQTLSWPANGTASGTIQTDVGQKNSLNLFNASAASATVTAVITGYSTEVETRDISGQGGKAGDAIVNDGAGGAAWGTPGRAFASYQTASVGVPYGGVYVGLLTVPPGSYAVSFQGTMGGVSATPDFAHCWLYSPSFAVLANGEAAVGAQTLRSTVAMQGLLTTALGGTIKAFCWSQDGQAMSMQYRSLVATQVGEVSGSFASARVAPGAGPAKR